MKTQRVVFGLLLFVLVMLMVTALQAQDGYLPMPTISDVRFHCDYDSPPDKDLYVWFTADVKSYYRINGDGPGLPADYHGIYANQDGIGYVGEMRIIVNNGSEPSYWSNLRIEMRQAYEQPDGKYTHEYVTVWNLDPATMDCRETPTEPITGPTPTPAPVIAAEVNEPAPVVAVSGWHDGNVDLGSKLNSSNDYGVFAGNFGIRVYKLKNNQLRRLLCVATNGTIQQTPINANSRGLLAVCEEGDVILFRESSGALGAQVKTGQGRETTTW